MNLALASARLRRVCCLSGALLALGLAFAGAASANAGTKIVNQCLHQNKVSGHYTQKAYQEALAHLPSDVAEYTDCGQLIRRAQFAAASRPPSKPKRTAASTGGGGGGGSGGGGGGGNGGGSGKTGSSSTPHGSKGAGSAGKPSATTAPQSASPAPPPAPSSFTPAERTAITQASATGGSNVDVGGKVVHPGLVHVNLASAITTLPSVLGVLLVLLGLGALLALGRLARDRLRPASRRPH